MRRGQLRPSQDVFARGACQRGLRALEAAGFGPVPAASVTEVVDLSRWRKAPNRPVLKHGPRSLTCVRVGGWQTHEAQVT